MLLLAGCSLEKESALNRGLQNLTAHYNILFNANEILRQKQQSYALSFVDSYNEILSVYQDTIAKSSADKDLEEAKVKGNKIINIKEQSHYLGDAYLVLGKANYLEGNYFDAVEFFSYVIRSFPKQQNLVQEALVWKARCMIYLNQLPAAKLVLDTAIQGINTKKGITADVYATKLQYDINVQDYKDAEEMGKKAIHYCREKPQRLRWTFILAQIQELNNENAEAIKNYTSIVKSNASFEMAFNADLNRIRIADNENGVKTSRIDRLKSLIKNENNKDFIDQIYYQIAEIYASNKDIDNAVKNYRLSVRNSKKNQNQKGLSYLRLADIYFKNKADYVGAKKYYDSTLLNLSPNYPGYQIIQKKSSNLALLADRFGTIAREDTLQMLAQLDEKTRATHIDAMVNRQILQEQAASLANNAGSNSFNTGGPGAGNSGTSSFYFYNSNAVSQGYNDFKRRWGNRKLEDNWRRSNRANSDITTNTSQNIDPDATPDQVNKSKNATTAGSYRQQLIKNLPLTPELLAQSNTRIYNAYFDIANFYRDILGDKKEAIAIYELLLNRFPDTPDKPALYYNLYRLYSDIDPPKSDKYKDLLLKNYADTPFAKIINDPEYSKRLNDADAGITALYNQVYDDYSKRDYKKTISGIDDMLKQYPNNKWSAQLAYLRAISEGHQEKLTPFKNDLNQILSKYPTDRLIIPLVKLHLAYIDANQTEMAARPVVLTDNGPNGIPFVPATVVDQPVINYSLQVAQKRIEPKSAIKQPVANQPASKPSVNQPIVSPTDSVANKTIQPVTVPPKKPVPSIYSMRDSTNYFFVINISSGTTNLASSRFGIGQFNRVNFPNGSITHQLTSVGDDNQLIYVGRFYSIGAVKDYAHAIIPLMPDIMKVPKEKYSFFIITQENLDKVNSKIRLDNYMDFYQNNY
ncbi:MAG: tetratricopeptide repeat protein [Mucilaginibacter sp.]|nr:tetratricopeptide repeat protein [Mucilaginibacter sp.]